MNFESTVAEDVAQALHQGKTEAQTHAMLRAKCDRNCGFRDWLLDRAIRALVGEHRRTLRALIVHQESVARPFTGTRRQAAVTGTARLVRETLMDFPLYGGGRLGNATRDAIMDSGAAFLAQGKTQVTNGKWLLAVGATMPKGVRCEDFYAVSKLQELRKAAERASH